MHNTQRPIVVTQQHTSSPLSHTDEWINAINIALITCFARPKPLRENPAQNIQTGIAQELHEHERKLSASLMRINHTGEICAQALYTAQALTTHDPELKIHLTHAAQEEIDHLSWCRDRLDQLGSQPSVFNPMWFTGAFAIGLIAGAAGGDRASLGFVIETEKQVETHLQSHLKKLPDADTASRAIVAQMELDEAEHAKAAETAGGLRPPKPIRAAMHLAGRVMTTIVRYV